jgi:ABC-type transport system substrate-binding protein
VATYWTTEANHFAPRVHLDDPTIEALYPQSLAASGDARVQIYKQMQQEMQANPVFFGLLQPDFISAYRTRVKGLKFWWSAQTFDMTKVSVS